MGDEPFRTPVLRNPGRLLIWGMHFNRNFQKTVLSQRQPALSLSPWLVEHYFEMDVFDGIPPENPKHSEGKLYGSIPRRMYYPRIA
jgi:hypothetical protein